MAEADETAVSELRAKLQPFLIRNPEAEVSEKEYGPVIAKPWGDESIELRVPDDSDDLLSALNAVRLPPQFTAVWHEDLREFEIIYTAMPERELRSRSFDFRFRGTEYHCAFEPASQRLMLIASASRPLGLSDTNHRNLPSLYMYEHSRDEHPESRIARSGEPTSFWIRGIAEYDNAVVMDFVHHLNFYMGYFDQETPKIIIHEAADRSVPLPQKRYPYGDFPEILSAKELDRHLLNLWKSASSGDIFLRFIQYYQILEYAAFYYIREDIMQSIQRVLTTPDTAAKPQEAAKRILEALVVDRTQDESKINEVIRRCVAPEILWQDIEKGREVFCKEVVLDGGFRIPAVISETTDLPDFTESWYQRFPPTLHRIRNALVHARESRQSTMIAPTRANQDRLYPWLAPLSLTAAHVMLYSNV